MASRVRSGLSARRPSSVPAAFFASALAFLAAAAVAAVLDAATGDWRWHWLALHLALLGGVSQLIAGAGQFFAAAFLATDPPGRRMVSAQLAAWATGTVLAAGSARRSSARFAFSAGPLGIVAWADLAVAAALMLANVAASARAAPKPMLLPARLVGLAQAFLLAGITVALVTAAGDATAPPAGDARRALAALLLAGWVGLTVAGSLLHLLAVLARVRDLRRPMPGPRPVRDRAVTVAAALAIAAFAASQAPALDGLRQVAGVAVACLAAGLAARVATLAARAIGPSSRAAIRGFPR